VVPRPGRRRAARLRRWRNEDDEGGSPWKEL